ncbi:hypothetical protein DY000_02011816 [Brassica cretica]|uniref:DUF4408 domain-containing protein n=1 Tax=Brassica cretica TaxID=69181 RepID=A0ABQ7CX81_BRACR|nr:hypothetical protein DY000_02011816 [Brassica cretica]
MVSLSLDGLLISREFLRRIAGVISTPLFVFLFGNCIVVALLAKSSMEENRGSAASNAETEIYEALVRSKPSDEEEEELAEEIVYDDKEVVVVADSSNNIPNGLEIDSDTCPVSDEPKEYGRSKSDPKVGFEQLVKMMVDEDLEMAKRKKVLVDAGYLDAQQHS